MHLMTRLFWKRRECKSGLKFHLRLFCVLCANSLTHVWLFVNPWMVACQSPLSMGFSKQEYWSGWHFILQGIFPTQELNLHFLCLLLWQGDFFLLLSHLGMIILSFCELKMTWASLGSGRKDIYVNYTGHCIFWFISPLYPPSKI